MVKNVTAVKIKTQKDFDSNKAKAQVLMDKILEIFLKSHDHAENQPMAD